MCAIEKVVQSPAVALQCSSCPLDFQRIAGLRTWTADARHNETLLSNATLKVNLLLVSKHIQKVVQYTTFHLVE